MLLPLVYIVLGALAAVYAAPLTTTTHEFKRSVLNNGTHLQVRGRPWPIIVKFNWWVYRSQDKNVPNKIKKGVIESFPTTVYGWKPRSDNFLFANTYNGDYGFFHNVKGDEWKRVLFSPAQEAIIQANPKFSDMRREFAKAPPIYIRFDGECDSKNVSLFKVGLRELPDPVDARRIGYLFFGIPLVDQLVFVGPFRKDVGFLYNLSHEEEWRHVTPEQFSRTEGVTN
ncbi:hypothetical protein J3R30DRAFT_3707989 [Lentinula aciculospora]|uniref:Uncharacterized protein n=1 Tax=Lentinula aciculospora TaxID=153920 RepID=A0A9W9DKB5_9AGAR|nr:hypothetical protein J3R30DRAFT_3707989 [Lentinula aciculospora]